MTLARAHRCTLTFSVERLSPLHTECYCINIVNVLMMPSALSRSFCSGKAIWWASEECCHRLLNSVTLQNTDGHYCNQHCLGFGILHSHCCSWRKRSVFSPYILNISRFNFPAISLQGLMSNATREDSGFFWQVLQRANCLLVHLRDRNQDFINLPVSILLKMKYFKAAYGTFTLNWIRKKEKHSTPNLTEPWWDLTSTVSLTATLRFNLGVTWRWWWWWWCNVVILFHRSLRSVRAHICPISWDFVCLKAQCSTRGGIRWAAGSYLWHSRADMMLLLLPITPPDSCQQLPYLFLHPVALPQTGTTLRKRVPKSALSLNRERGFNSSWL